MEPDKLKRESAGRYVSADGRFAVEQSSGRWLTIDAESTDELGLPLVRGPFATLDEARAAIAEARQGPRATSTLETRLKARPRQGRTPAAATRRSPAPKKPREPTIELRDFEPADGASLRALWKAAGFGSVGDDDRSLAAFAARNPGLLLVATADGAVIGSALGGWDGRRGWIYHVATAEAYRRKGIATRLVRRLEQRLRVAGAPKVNAVVRDEDETARTFWKALGYEVAPTRQFARDL
jgi:ribosomal protein S18 acetylase RimI-like enzyme